MNKFKLNKTFLFLTVILFLTEVLIALYVRDNFIRPYFGDVLATVLVYCAVKSFFPIPPFPMMVSSLIFSYLIEGLQYLQLLELLQLQDNQLAICVLGSSFSWEDMIAYTCGGAAMPFIDLKFLSNTNPINS